MCEPLPIRRKRMTLLEHVKYLAVAAPASPDPSPAELFLLAGAFFVATVILLIN